MSRRILTFSLFEAARTSGLTKRQEDFLNKYTRGTWTYNSSTGLVNVDGDFDCGEQGLSDFKGVRFGKVGGEFKCHGNNLTTLEGAPQEVGGYFSCVRNRLTSLEGAPQRVGGDFYCRANRLTSLEGAPREVGGGFNCGDNRLTTLEGAPREVKRVFYCDENRLTSLKGAPREVKGDFHCYYNQLTTLEGAPQKVRGKFRCHYNQLTSLEGAPREVGGNFHCDAFSLEKDEWNPKGWLKVLKKGKMEARQLIATLLSPEALNPEIQKDPAGMAITLKKVWNDESFRETRDKLVWPKGYEQEADLLGDLDDVGF